jgi:hypothetical protein
MTTIAGVAFRQLDGLPKVGDIVVLDDLELSVLEMDLHRIARLRVRRVTRADEIAETQHIADVTTAEAPVTQTTGARDDKVVEGAADSEKPAAGDHVPIVSDGDK